MVKEKHADPGCQVMDTRTDGEWAGTNDRGNKRAGRVPNAQHLEWLRFVESGRPAQIPAAGEDAGAAR